MEPPRTRTPTLLLCSLLLLAACGQSRQTTEGRTEPPPSPAPARGAPSDVPLYYEDADAKKTAYEVTEKDIIITMETINGALSPITYYRSLGEAGWEIVQDTENNGGTILATKKDRELEVTFETLPEGAGTIITLRTTKEED